MDFFWHPSAEQALRDLGLSPLFDALKAKFDEYDFYTESDAFGAASDFEPGIGRHVYYVVFRIDRPVLMDLTSDEELVSHLLVRCIPSSPDERRALYAKYTRVVRGIVLSAANASDLGSPRVAAEAAGHVSW